MATDWNSLSPKDFERIVRDLLGRTFNDQVECFTEGADGGIDLRLNSGKIIVQCKRYKDFNKLFSVLKKDSESICSKFCNQRYFLATSLGLTPANKEKIKGVLKIISSTQDILAADDLEGMLAKNSEVRKLYPQLWLGDEEHVVALVEQVFNSAIDNCSKDEYKKIVQSMTYMVQHPMFDEAIKILGKNRAIIITGPPGIGKTSLANHLIWHVTQKSKDYEFVFICSDIKEAEQKYKEEKNQIFLYDDFLGSNFLNQGLTKNEDRNIYSFIEKVRKTKNKLLIFTTREYVLQQAVQTYAHVQNACDKIRKIVLNISSASLIFKARILYNHLWCNQISGVHVNCLLEREYRSKRTDLLLFHIVEHESYNPRIVATCASLFQNKSLRKDLAHDILDSLDHPNDIYEHVFRNNLTRAQRRMLLVLCSYPTGCELEKLHSHFFVSETSTYDDSLKDVLRVLEGDFVVSSKDRNDNIIIDFINPGVRDFLYYYLNENRVVFAQLVAKSQTIEQVLHLYSLVQMNAPLNSLKGFIEKDIVSKGVEIVNKEIDDGKYCPLFFEFFIYVYSNLKEKDAVFLKKIVQEEENSGFSYLNSDNQEDYLDCFSEIVQGGNISFSVGNLCQKALDEISTIDILYSVRNFLNVVEESDFLYDNFSLSTAYWEECFIQTMEDSSVDVIEENISQLQWLFKGEHFVFDIFLSTFVERLREIISEKEDDEHYCDDDSWNNEYSGHRKSYNTGDKQRIIMDFQALASQMSDA